MIYKVKVTRVEKHIGYAEVDADSIQEAEEYALQQAADGDIDFEDTVDFSNDVVYDGDIKEIKS
jgi:hypothetical protein